MILHLVTNRRRLSPRGSEAQRLDCLVRQIQQAIAAGVDVVQIRERDLEAGVLWSIAAEAVRLSRGTATRVVVNDRLDVALAVGADGVHLPARSLPVTAVRQVTPAGFLIGRSVHTADELPAAFGADYVIAGTVWPSVSKPGQCFSLGVAGLAAMVRISTVPVLAIGGIDASRLAEVAATGVAGAAAIGLFIDNVSNAECGAFTLDDVVRDTRRRFDTPESPDTPANSQTP